MGDTYLITNAPYDASDVLLTTAAASGAAAVASTGGRGFIGFPQRKVIPGAGHLHVTFTLHGEGNPVLVTGQGRLRVSAALSLAASSTARFRSPSILPLALTLCGHFHDEGHPAPPSQPRVPHIDPADLWLLLDMPELA